jgi:hypothetical protein
VLLPTWFRTVAPHLVGHQVVLVFPVPFALRQSSMTWQAVDGMSFAMVGGGGPGSIASRAGKEVAGQTYIANLSVSESPQSVTPDEVTAVRQALDGWGVTSVVVPDTRHLPPYEQLDEVRTTVLLMTASIGRPPARSADAWVWTGVDRAGPHVDATAARLAACGAGPADGSVTSIQATASCIAPGTPVAS